MPQMGKRIRFPVIGSVFGAKGVLLHVQHLECFKRDEVAQLMHVFDVIFANREHLQRLFQHVHVLQNANLVAEEAEVGQFDQFVQPTDAFDTVEG